LSGRFLACPTWAACRYFARLYLLVGALFAVVFLGSEWVIRQHAWRVRIALPGEELLPFLPAWTWVYCSIYLPIHAAPFVLGTSAELRRLARVLTGVILTAGLGFILVPAELSYPAAVLPGSGATAALFRWADAVNLDHELFPSLHVALSSTCLAIYARYAPAWIRTGLLLWAGLIGVSTVLTQQHHVVDVLAGWAIAAVAVRRYAST
jgi:membrane-associated phospholipid phosphatase